MVWEGPVLRPLLGQIWKKLWVVTGASVHAPRQKNSTYVHAVRRYIYKNRWPEHPHLPIRRYEWRPQGYPLTAPLHEILPVHGPTIRYGYVYVYGYVYNPVHLCLRHDHQDHCTAASSAHPPSHQVSNTSPVIGIISFSGNSFWLDLTHKFRFD